VLEKNIDKTALFGRLVEGNLAPGDVDELIKWLGSDKYDPQTAELILTHLKKEDIDSRLSPDIIDRLEARLPLIFASDKGNARVIPFFGRKWLRYAAAIVLLAGLFSIWFITNRQDQNDPQSKIAKLGEQPIQPGKEGAILTLDDGTVVVLDSLKNGLITTQNGTKVLLRNGQLVYDADQLSANSTVYNTMSTPKGRQFQLILPDGSQVWLNAASSIRYPTSFTGNDRRVEITGEAYFEVAHNPSVPFKVEVNKKSEVTVLGTHFNINSYENEESVSTTLLEGSVQVKNESGMIILKPGQQAKMVGLEKINVLNDVNLDKVMAWKNGVFNFEDATLQEVMRQLERWYDIDVVYEKNIPKLEFFGKMGKDLSLAAVLSGLEKSNVHFRMEEGRRLVVLP
jgi:ferric-dicitrate binding protein FerR (iron transport regulator)